MWDGIDKMLKLHVVAEKHSHYGSVDLAFLMDCTGSMGSWIEVAKTQLFKIVENTKAKLGVKLRVAYVGCALGLQPFGIEPSSFLAAC